MTQIKTPNQLEIEYQNAYWNHHISDPEKLVFTNAKTPNKPFVYRVFGWFCIGLLLVCLMVLLRTAYLVGSIGE